MGSEKDANTEQAILEAAEKLFLQKGFGLTSTTEIARQAGCNQALIHYYFRTKENLFQKVFEQKIKMFTTAFFSIDHQGGTFQEKLARRIELHFDILEKNPKLPFLILNEISTNPKRFDALKESVRSLPLSVVEHLDRELQAEIEKGTIRPITAVDLLLTVISLNVPYFLMSPILYNILEMSEEEYKALIRHRRKENIETVLRSLRP